MRTLSAALTAAQKSYNVNPKWKVSIGNSIWDLSQYTEVDAASKVSYTNNLITFPDLERQDTCYIYRDMGVNYFSADYTHYTSFYLSSMEANSVVVFWALANTVGDEDDLVNTARSCNMLHTVGTTLYLLEREGVTTNSDTTTLATDTWYYATITRDETADTLTAVIYTDAARSTVFDTLTVSISYKKDWRYIYAFQSFGNGASFPTAAVAGFIGVPYSIFNEVDYLLDIKHTDRQYSSTAELIFTNHDGTFTDNDYTGVKSVVSYGALDTNGAAAYSACAPMWVKNQNLISGRGTLLCRMELIGLFDLLDLDKASAEYTQDVDNTDAIDTIFSAICAGTLTPFSHCSAVTVVDTSKDTLFDTYIPAESFSIAMGESRLSALKRLIALTGSVMRVDNDGSDGAQITVFAPTTTGTTYDYDYELAAGEHAFFTKGITSRVVLPNKVTVSSYPDTGDGYTGSATDAASYALLPKDEYWYLPVADNDECTNLATAILLHYQIGNGSGSGEVVMNVGAELYDYVDIIDSRENDTIVGNVLYQYRHCGRGKWNMTIGFGEPELGRGFLDIAMREPDKDNLLQEVNRLRYDLDTIIGYLKRVEGDVSAHERLLSTNGLPANILRNAMQPYLVDLNIKAKDANEIYWYGAAGVGNDGVINFADGTSLTITEKTQASAQTVSGLQWLYFTMGSSNLSITSTWTDAIGSNKGIVALCVENTASDGDCLILPCNGREPLINAIAISCDYLSALAADMGTLTAGRIELLKSGTSWTSWKNPNTADGIVLGYDSAAYSDGGDGKIEGYDAGAITFAVNKYGMVLFGDDKSFVTCKYVTTISSIETSGGGANSQFNTAAAHGLSAGDEIVIHNTDDYNGNYTVGSVVDADSFTVTGLAFVASETTGKLYTVQCKVDANGAITAGKDVLRLDTLGATIKAQNDTSAWLRFEDSDGNLLGKLRLTSAEDMNFVADNDLWIWCGAGSGGDIQLYCQNGGGIYCSASEGFTVPGMSAAPSSPSAGTMYFDSDDSKLKVYNGAGWDDLN